MLSKPFRPGTDLLFEEILRHPFVINIITKALLNTEDDYIPQSSEWPDGTRSVVLAHKSADTDHPPIIVQFQRFVDKTFMKRAIRYCRLASKRFSTEPIILTVCIQSVEVSVKESFRKCDDSPCYTAPCGWWAGQCYVIDEYSIQNHIAKDNLDPFVALGLFFTSQAPALHLAPRSTDPTVIMLYRISLDVYTKLLNQQTKSVNELKELHGIYCAQYEKILNLLEDEDTPKSSILEYVSQLAEYNNEQKRKYDELSAEDNSEDYQNKKGSRIQKTEFGGSSTEDCMDGSHQQEIESDYETRMEFIKEFMQDRAENGLTMSWELCLSEGKQKCNWNYKNANSLRVAFAKYGKRKQ